MFYDKVFLFLFLFFMGKVLSGELLCMQTDLVLLVVHTAWVGMSNHWYVGMSYRYVKLLLQT